MEQSYESGSTDRSSSFEVGQASHIGMIRSLNEDTLLVLHLFVERDPQTTFLGFYAVADGMGGHEGGEIASDLAIRTLTESTIRSLLLAGLSTRIDPVNQERMLQTLTDGVKAANSEVYKEAQKKQNDMGTTLATALVLQNTAYIANVGDSRVYLLAGNNFNQITKDHSLVADLVATGEINSEEVYTHPRRNIITRCVGTLPDIEVDLFTEVLNPGSLLVLCSDGLWEMVRDNKMKEILLSAKSPQDACERLVQQANQQGGVDNISVIVVKAVK